MTDQIIQSVKIITPNQIVLECDEAVEVLLPGQDGIFGVMSLHEPLLANLKPGIIVVVLPGKKYSYFVFGGVARVTQDVLSVTTNYAIDVAKVDKKQVESELSGYIAHRNGLDEFESVVMEDKISCLEGLLEAIK